MNEDEATLRMLLDEARRERNGMQQLAQRNRAEAERLRDERDQALIRAEAAENELDAYRRADRVQERRAS